MRHITLIITVLALAVAAPAIAGKGGNGNGNGGSGSGSGGGSGRRIDIGLALNHAERRPGLEPRLGIGMWIPRHHRGLHRRREACRAYVHEPPCPTPPDASRSPSRPTSPGLPRLGPPAALNGGHWTVMATTPSRRLVVHAEGAGVSRPPPTAKTRRRYGKAVAPMLMRASVLPVDRLAKLAAVPHIWAAVALLAPVVVVAVVVPPGCGSVTLLL